MGFYLVADEEADHEGQAVPADSEVSDMKQKGIGIPDYKIQHLQKL